MLFRAPLAHLDQVSLDEVVVGQGIAHGQGPDRHGEQSDGDVLAVEDMNALVHGNYLQLRFFFCPNLLSRSFEATKLIAEATA